MKQKATLEVLLTDELIHSNNFMPLWNGIQSRSRPFVCWFAPLLSSGKESSFLVESNQVDTVYSLFSQNQLHITFTIFFPSPSAKYTLNEFWKPKRKQQKNESKKSIWCCCRNYLSQLCISVCEKFISQCYGSNAPNSCIACMLTKENGFSPQTAMNSVGPPSSCRWA